MEWGYGLVRGLRPRLFGDISFVDFSPERVAQYRRFIDILPSHTMSWRFLGRLAEAGAGSASPGVYGNEAARAVYEDFVRHRPRSRLTPWALAELVAHYRRLYKATAREDIEKKVVALAREAGVPARAIGDALGPSRHSGGLGGAVRQWVYLDPEETPAEIMLAFETERSGWRRCFWGPDIIRWGTPRTEERWPMGELPPAGRWVQLTCPVAALKLEGQTVKQMIFAVQAGRATWDLTEYVADGDNRVLLDDELPKGAGFSGGGKGKWVESPVKSGRRAHTNGDSRGAGTRDYRTVVRFKVDPGVGQTKEPTKEELHRYVEAAGVLPDTEEAFTLLRRAEAMYDALKESTKRAEAVADMYADFLRASPRTPLAHRILTHCRRTFERASVQDAVARCETIMNEISLSRTQRRRFYGEYAAGIPHWQILGYFDGGAPRAGKPGSLLPERSRVNLNVTYRRGDGRRLAWREIAARGGVVDFRAQVAGAGLAALKEGTKWPVAYLYTRLASPRRQKVSLTVKVRGKCLAWLNGKRAGPVVQGREHRGSEFSIPVSLKKGVNEILLKVSERDGAARLVCRVADLNGRPLEGGGPGGLESRLPPRLLGVLAYERADETRLVFSRPVDPVSAGMISNYTIDGGVAVKSARVAADGRTVVLATSKLSPEATYTITVTNVADTGEPPDYVEPGTRMKFSRKVKGTGVGLKGEYFDEQDLTKLKLTRIDATVNFDWDEGSPDPAVPSEGFSVRWTGRVEPLASGPYAFHTVTDDGVRLWVDGKKLIDNWTLHAATEDTGEMELQAGRLYSIKMEFFEGAGNAIAKLLWTDPIRGKEVVPTSQLYP